MRRLRFIVLPALALALIAIAVGILVARAPRRTQAMRTTTNTQAIAATTGKTVRASRESAKAVHAKHRTPAPTMFTIVNAPDRSARLWLARADQVSARKRTRQFGPEVAALLDQSAADAWNALRKRASDGDEKAALAAMLLLNECKALAGKPPEARSPHRSTTDPFDAAMLPAGWIRFLHGIDTAQQSQREARTASCADIGGVWDFALMALDRFVDPHDPQAQLDEIESEPDDAETIPALRRLANQLDTDAARSALGEQLLESRDPQDQDEGRELLEKMAANNPTVVGFLANCFRNGCGAYRGNPDAAPTWVERAAGLGFPWALQTCITDLQTAEQPGEAWAWALYRLELARAGCTIFNRPDMITVANAAQCVFQIQATLSVAQQAQARATLAAIERSWLAPAMAALDCDP
ncbi:MAG: hypothetical protein WB784_03065 [Rhodanobacteraceae bacterium]